MIGGPGEDMADAYDAIVVGGGHNGLVAVAGNRPDGGMTGPGGPAPSPLAVMPFRE